MIKSVRVNPVILIGSNAAASVFVGVDAAELYALYLKNGIDPATVKVPTDSNPEGITLDEAVAAGLEVIASSSVRVSIPSL